MNLRYTFLCALVVVHFVVVEMETTTAHSQSGGAGDGGGNKGVALMNERG